MSTLAYGGTVTGIGLLVVFVGLAILIGMIMLVSVFIRRLDARARLKNQQKRPAPKAEPRPAPALEPAPVEAVTDPGELIAVIAAAIAAFDGNNKGLVIRSVRRVSGWKNAARAEQVYKY